MRRSKEQASKRMENKTEMNRQEEVRGNGLEMLVRTLHQVLGNLPKRGAALQLHSVHWVCNSRTIGHSGELS